MFKNYLVTGIRNVLRNPVYFLINLFGLATGLTCCILILLFVTHELNYDQFHSRKERIYRVNYDVVMGGRQTISPSVPDFVGPHLKRMFPEVENMTRFMGSFSPRTLRYENNIYDEDKFAWADSSFFSVLDFKSVEGDLKTALRRPNTVVITRAMATKYFGTNNPIGKSLISNNNKSYEITAVIEDVPGNSHFTFNFLGSISSLEGLSEDVKWNNPNYVTFLQLKPQANVAGLQQKIDAWVNPAGQNKQDGNRTTLDLEPLSKVHFNTSVFNFGGQLALTDFKYVVIFITIAFLVLAIACFNYINLSTAMAITRAKEVGLRKTVGASVTNTIIQFLTEAFVLMLPSILLSIIGVILLLPSLNDLLGKSIAINIFSWKVCAGIFAGWVLLSISAGLYPAFVISRFKPASIFRGSAGQTSGISLRKVLVVVQFSITISLLVGTVVIISQLNFMQSRNLGMNKEQVVMIRGNSEISSKLEAYIAKAKSLPGVVDGCRTWRSPFLTVVGNGFNLSPQPGDEGWVTVGAIAGDADYLKTLDLKLLAGNDFDANKVKDTVNEFIVNEAFLRDFGVSQKDAIGKQSTLGMVGAGTIVGVVADFHISSLHNKVAPIVLFNHPDYFSGVLLRLAPDQVQSYLASLEKTWKEFAPLRPFNFSFLDEQYDAMYRTEQRVSKLVGFFSAIAIVVGCLGLMGLSSFTTLQRAKEIGIRKVLGATTGSIVFLLSNGYLKPLLVSLALAVPCSYYLLSRWLEGFAYHIAITPVYFGVAFMVVVVVAFFTVGYQSYKASVANPAKVLKNE